MPLVGASPEEPIRLFSSRPDVMPPLGKLPPRLGALAAILVVLLVLSGGVLFFIASNADARLAFSGLQPKASGAGIEHPVAPPIAQHPASHLLVPRVDYSQTFSGFSSDPAKVCAAFASIGFETTGWHPSPVALNGWECSSTRTPATVQETDGAPRSSLFFMFRGSEAGRVGTLHLKMNLLAPEQREVVMRQALQILATLDGFADLAVPVPVTNAVSTLTPMDIATFSARFRFEAERGEPDRFNLTVVYSPRISRVFKVSSHALESTGRPALDLR